MTSSFIVFRSDRNLELTGKSHGGGCLIAIKNYISANRVTEWENELPFENIWLQINLKQSHKKLFIHTAYITPNTKHNAYKTYFDHYTNILCNSNIGAEFILLGDFNLNQISWLKTGNNATPLIYDGPTASDFINLMEIANLTQLNHVHNSNGRILDLVLVNFEGASLYETDKLSKVDTHHPPLAIEIKNTNIKFLKSKRAPKINFFKLNYNSITTELNKINWDDLLDMNDLETATNNFYQTLYSVIHKYQ